ncbi:MAG: VCBS repeat-containing protein [Planctomycetota bacterium]
MRWGLFVLLFSSFVSAQEEPYGFRGMEIYKFEWKTTRLTPADLDGDGLSDLLLANNRDAKIEIMLRRKEPVPMRTRRGDPMPNDLVDDRFFEMREILTEKEVFSLAAADLNNDGHVDVAYFGNPAELVVVYGDGTGHFPKTTRLRADDGSTLRRGLATGDLNGDGRTDLAHVGKGFTAVWYQAEDGTLGEPRKLPHSDKGVAVLQLVDVNGDNKTDLVHLLPSSKRSVRVRYQQADGTLGPVVALATEPWRLGAFLELDGAPGADLAVVQRSSGVLRTMNVVAGVAAEGNLGLGHPLLYSFEGTGGKKARTIRVGDVNGDGRNDVVVSEPDTAQVALYLQAADGTLAGRKAFPSLATIEDLCVADLDGDKRAEIVVLSKAEGTVGVAKLGENGRLPFPRLIDLPGKPLAIGAGRLMGDGPMQLLVISEKDKKRTLHVHGAGSKAAFALEGLKSGPDAVRVHDFNQDGKPDVVLLDRFGKARVWSLGERAETIAEIKGAGAGAGMLNRLAANAVSFGDVNGNGKDELILAAKNYARALRLGADGAPQVVDQANGRSPRSQIKGAVTADLNGDKQPEIVLFDRDGNSLTILQRDDAGVFAVVGSVDLGTLDYRGLMTTDLNGDGRDDLLVAGRTRFALLHGGGRGADLREKNTFERRLEFSSFGYFEVGDFNADGGTDVAIIDRGKRAMVIASYSAKDGFRERLAWPIYDKKMHENEKQGGGAREVTVADFDGDGKHDLAVLIHDRVIVYLQG